MKKKSGFPGIFAGIVIAAVFFIGIGLFRGSGGRHYSTVPTYELMVRDVKAGDVKIRIPSMDAFPEDEYVYMVSYKNRWFGTEGQGYTIHSTRDPGEKDWVYEVISFPLTEKDTPRETNAELLGVPVEIRMDDDNSDGLWVGQIIFDLDGYRYRVRYENWKGEIVDVQEKLEEMTVSVLSDVTATAAK